MRSYRILFRMAAALLYVSIAFTCCSVCYAQEKVQTVRILDQLESQDYSGYLQQADKWLTKMSPEKLERNFSGVVALAISLDKTNQSGTELAQRIETLLSVSPNALRYFQATKLLLNGDVAGMSLYFQGTPPEYSSWQEQMRRLRNHHYTVAANAFAVIYMTGSTGLGTPHGSRETEAGVKALASFTPEQRASLEDIVSARLKEADNWYAPGVIAQSAIRLCRKADDVVADIYFDIACEFGAATGDFFIAAARDLRAGGKRDLAVRAAMRASDASPQDVELQCEAGEIVSNYADPANVQLHYQKAMAAMQKPLVRELRVQYLKWSASKSRQAKLDVVPAATFLSSADRRLVQGAPDEAAQEYEKAARDKRLSVEDRLDAVAGLLSAKSETAISEMGNILKELQSASTDQAKAAELSRWAAWQVWASVKPSARQAIRVPGVAAQDAGGRMITSKPQIAQAASLMQQLIGAYPEACLREPQAGGRSLRIATAVLLALSEQPDKAADILARRITYQVQPPDGGWRNPPGAPAPGDAYQARVVSSPEGNDMDRWARQVIPILQKMGADSGLIKSTEQAFRKLVNKSQ